MPLTSTSGLAVFRRELPVHDHVLCCSRINVTHKPPRWLLPLLVGVLTFGFVWVGQAPPGVFADFDYIWAGGVAVWQGTDPYTAVPDRAPYYYPATAAVLMAPFAPLPRQLAVALFTALGMTLLAFSVTGYRRWIVLSAPALQALLYGHWTPWLTAAVGLPWLGFIWAVKPNIGLALFGGWPSRAALYGGLAVVVLSFLVIPTWPADWLKALQTTTHYLAPIQRPGGFLLLLAWLRWREPEARLLGALAVIPHSAIPYELLPLLLIPQTRRRFLVLMGLTYLAVGWVEWGINYDMIWPRAGAEMVRQVQDIRWPWFLFLVYLPCLWMVLRRPSFVLSHKETSTNVITNRLRSWSVWRSP
jgi:hypothetical protein